MHLLNNGGRMTDNDIIRFAHMPRYSQQQTDLVLATEAFAPINEIVEYVSDTFNQIVTLTTAHQKISRHGVTSYIIDEYADRLSAYSINFETQSVSACLEGLSSLVERMWVAIKNALSRLLEYLKTNPYFAQWFNRCEFYRSKMASLISGQLRNYIKADIESFNSIMMAGWNYGDFVKTMNYTAVLISRLKGIGSYRIEDIDIGRQFYDVFMNLNASFVDGVVTISNPGFERKSTNDLDWKPNLVYYISNTLYSKVAVNSMTLTRMQREFERILTVAIQECNNVLSGREDGNDDTKVTAAKNRIRNIRNIQNLIQLAVSNTCFLCSQWCKLASSFDTGERPYPA